jgi:iron complex outermembrane receptor protein
MRLIIVVILFFAVHYLHGQTFEAQVIDADTRKPIPSVRVQVVETGITGSTDSLGHVKFPSVAFSQITIKIYHSEYEVYTSQFECGSEDHALHLIELIPAHHALDEVEILSVRGGKQSEVVTPVVSKSVQDLNTIQRMTLLEGITTMPGVQSLNTGIGIAKPVIRGLSGNRVLTYFHGIRYENQQWGNDHGLGITDLGVSRVEVIKGPASLQFGSDALGGVIFLIDDEFTPLDHTEITLKANVESVNFFSGNKLWVKTSNKHVRLSAGFGFNTASDYRLPSGDFVNSSYFQDRYGRFNINWGKKRNFNTIRYSYQQSYVGLPGHTHDSIVNYDDLVLTTTSRAFRTPRQEISTHVASWESNTYFQNSTLQTIIGWNYNKLTELEEKITIPAVRFNTHSVPFTFRWKRKLKYAIDLQVGTQGMFQLTENAPEAEEKLVENTNTIDNGLFVIANKKWNNLTAQIGLRGDIRTVQLLETKNNRSFLGFNGSAGFVYSAKSNLIRMNYSSGFRAPTSYELTANGQHHGSFRYEIGDVNLKSEIAHQVDFAYEFNGEHLALTINPFLSYVANYVDLEATDSVIDALPVFMYKQLDNVLITGGDVGVHYHPHFAHFLHIESSYSYLYTRNELGNALNLVPQNRLLSSLKFTFARKGKFRINHIALEHHFFDRVTRFGSFETKSGAYQLFNIGLSSSYFTKMYHIEFNTGVKNLMNEEFIPHTSQLKRLDLAQPGRSIYIQLVFHLNFKK